MSGSKIAKEPVVFRDAIHGCMTFLPLCMDIMNTVQFLRLRNIKQMGLCYYIYPSASHNRFEHCLGTCYIGGKMIRHLIKEQQSKGCDPGLNERHILCVEIAGLCHDLGHAPFSHIFEKIIKENTGYHWEHEETSCKMFQHLVDQNPHIKKKLSPDEIELIKCLITGESKGRKEPKYIFQIINNKLNGIDVDKWDYIARDSYYVGLGNSFRYERMLKFSKVINGNICYRDKTVVNFYEMFYSRYRLYKKICYHKKVILINNLFEKAMKDAFDKLNIREKINDMKQFTYFTDSILEKIFNSKDKNLAGAKEILNDLITIPYIEVDEHSGEDVEVCNSKVGFTSKKVNPLLDILFYKKGENTSFKYDIETLKKMMPLPDNFYNEFKYYFKRQTKT
ncbi:deoxynucleoside triphosphate triphosphohydrolase SAMHD1 homolog [Argonauta hians]